MISQNTYKNWHQNKDSDGILWLALDKRDAQVNSLNTEILLEFSQLLDEIDQDSSLVGMVIQSAKASGFIAGADIEQFVGLQDPHQAFELIRQSQLIFDKLALLSLKIPTVALIKGFCLGGGLELALACRYRVADDGDKTQLGAPEVRLGFHPGWGGTVRLPRLIGLFPAMRMNLSGISVNAKTAAKLGLVDVITPERHLVRAARYYIQTKPVSCKPRIWGNIFDYSFLRPWIGKIFYKNLTGKVMRKLYPAPYAIVDNWIKNGVRGESAFIREAESIAELMTSNSSKNLVRAFFLQTRLKGLGKKVNAFSPKHVHVIGAGVMGGDIAAWCAMKGFEVTLQDQLPEALSPAVARANVLFQKKLKSPNLVQAALDRLIPDVMGDGISKADIVIEAVSEKLVVKQTIYQAIEPKLKSGAILATNTSSLSLDQLNQCLQHPERLVGIHFFNPVAKMQLVEVVQGSQTESRVMEQAIAFVRMIDRLPLPVKSCPGFLVNRVLMPYLMEAMVLFDEGKSPEIIDKAALDFGMPMGPIELADTIGLDICLSVAEILAVEKSFSISEVLKNKVEQGHMGRKSNQGFYAYKKKTLIKKKVSLAKSDDMAEITDRLILPILNETIGCLREKIAADADLLDAGLIFGTGFAPFRGGPLQYARTEGVSSITARLEVLESLYGERFKPDTGWHLLQ